MHSSIDNSSFNCIHLRDKTSVPVFYCRIKYSARALAQVIAIFYRYSFSSLCIGENHGTVLEQLIEIN